MKWWKIVCDLVPFQRPTLNCQEIMIMGCIVYGHFDANSFTLTSINLNSTHSTMKSHKAEWKFLRFRNERAKISLKKLKLFPYSKQNFFFIHV